MMRRALAAALILGLAACAAPGPDGDAPATGPRPLPRPEQQAEAPDTQAELRRARAERNREANAAARQAAARPSQASQSQRDLYAAAERRLVAQGRLRRDRVPLDAPVNAEILARNFIEIALRDEYLAGGGLARGGAAAPLRRWQVPVRMQIEFGASIDMAARPAWRAEVGDYAARLSSITGHPVSMTAERGNFTILVLTEDERRAIGPRLAQLVPGIPARDLSMVAELPASISCAVFAYSEGGRPDYARAVAVIRAELPPLLRSSCIHEELAQGMGLANDSPDARPSIFNDDEEFALLTRHDELLLQMLYDPRLRPGMSEAEAAPIIRRIAAELMGEAA